MKKLKTITDELKELIREASAEKDPKVKKKLKLRIPFLRMCVMYVESNPSDDFINSEIERINNRIEKISDGFEYWKTLPREKEVGDKKLLTFYYKEMGVPKLRRQLQALRFLLK